MTRKLLIGNNRPELLVCLLLAVAICLVYRPVINHAFVNYDDGLYVTDNAHVQGGLSLEGFIWAFRSNQAGNWHPLTWLSHMLDVQIYGMDPGGHHFTNLFFHIVNSILVFFVFRRMTGESWQSGLVAALFALHPLHVESVAWVSERKDVLSAFFGLLTLLCYACYTEHGKPKWYLAALSFFILGLLSKPMLVTLPFVLLLVDFWPLRRLQFETAGEGAVARSSPSILNLLLEKIPFLFLAVAAGAVTIWAQQNSGFVGSLKVYPLTMRFANAVVAYVSYIEKMLWPNNLSVFYPYALKIPLWQVTASALILLGITIAVVRALSQRPYLFVGWCWYLGTLVPVIGLVQVGAQAMADRYTYLPLIGLFIMIAWGAPDLIGGWHNKATGMIIGAAAILLILGIGSNLQVRHWRDSIALFKHALAATENNALAHFMVAEALSEKGELNEATVHLAAGLKIQPSNPGAYNNLANILAQQGQVESAIGYYRKTLKINPKQKDAHYNLANALMTQGKTAEAIQHYFVALRLDPYNLNLYNNLANAQLQTGRVVDAMHNYVKALRINPNDPEVHNNFGVALVHAGKSRDAIKQFEAAMRLKPDYAEAKNNLHKALKMQPK